MRSALVALICVTLLGLIVFATPDHAKMERDPSQEQTYRAYVNHGIAAREAGHYSEALTSLLYAHKNAPHSSKVWLTATINLAMCCEVLGNVEAADRYYLEAGKFCVLSNHMRTVGAWRKMRRKIELNELNETDGGRAASSTAEPLISSEDTL